MSPEPSDRGRCGLIIEEPGRDWLRWIRTAAAALVALAILAASGLAWDYARRVDDEVDVAVIATVAGLTHFATEKWLRRRERRAEFRWRRSLVLPGGVRPGLQARWSRAAFAIDALVAVGFVASGLLHFGAAVGDGSRWYGPIGSSVAAALAGALAVAAFRRLRCSGYVTITSWGVTYGGRLIRWEEFRSANRRKSGVYLRLREPADDPAFVEFSATACAVSDARLTEVLKFYLADPHRRSALDTGPERLTLPARP